MSHENSQSIAAGSYDPLKRIPTNVISFLCQELTTEIKWAARAIGNRDRGLWSKVGRG